jgi:ferritin-like metal-binding protein YciE
MENLRELLIQELKDLYSAEKQIVKALPKVIRGTASDELKAAITEHLEVTKDQVKRLDQVFGYLDQKPKAEHCKGMEGLLTEGAECLEEEDKGTLRDLQLIGGAQRIEHYEVAAYGTAKAMAEKIGLAEAAELLGETLAEEEEADTKLTEVADGLYAEIETGYEAAEERDNGAPAANRGRRTPTKKKAARKR